MKATVGSRRHYHTARLSIFLMTITMVAGMVGFPASPGLSRPFRYGFGIPKVTGAEVTTMAQSSANVTTYEGDLIMDGYQEFVIENCTWIQKGNICVRDHARLTINNATVIMPMATSWPAQLAWRIDVRDQGFLEMTGSQLQPGDTSGSIQTIICLVGSACAEITSSQIGNVYLTEGAMLNLNWSLVTQGVLWLSGNCKVKLLNSSVGTQSGPGCPVIALDVGPGAEAEFEGLKAGRVDYWNLREDAATTGIGYNLEIVESYVANWQIFVDSRAKLTISNSDVLWFTVSLKATSFHLTNLKPGLQNWRHERIVLENAYVTLWDIGVSDDAVGTIENCHLGFLRLEGGGGHVSVVNSTVSDLLAQGYGYIVEFADGRCTGGLCLAGFGAVLGGNVDFSGACIVHWYSSTVKRTYEVGVSDRYGNLVSGATLTLLSPDNTKMWSGTTDPQGRASFDVTFTDNNYADTLRLEAVKGDLFDAQNVSFLSDTPVVLTLLAQYGLKIASTTGGRVTAPGEGTFTYDEGTRLSLVAEAERGYRFVNWTGDVGTIADVNDATTTITMNGDYSITANFEEIPEHTLTISSTAGGSVTTPGEGEFTYEEGTVVGLEAKPEKGCQFVKWTGDVDTIANVEGAFTTIAMNGDYSITATFEAVGGCFIATAAYGTPMAEEIQILREFRDKYVLTNPLGQVVVDIYYKVSPPIAEFIAEHPSLKPIVRARLSLIVALCNIVFDIAPRLTGNAA